MVLTELRMLAVWTGCQIGLLSGKHAHVITQTPFNAAIVNVKHAMYRKKFYLSGIKLVEALENMCQLQQVPFDMREFAEQLLTMLTSLEGEAYAIMKASQGKNDREEDKFLANVLIEVVQAMKKEVCKDPDYLKVLFKNSIQNSATASWKELGRVLRVLKRMLLATVAEATPSSEEAQRILSFFINSLGHPNLDKPPQMDKMCSHSILTPCYEEDVLYPLESGALAEELGLKKKNIVDLMTEVSAL
jgi:1,3-beta-glucan synthase